MAVAKFLFSPIWSSSIMLLASISFLIQLSWLPLSLALSTTITHLPGFQGPLPFHLETGYVSVNETHDAQVFYYFIKSEGKPEEDPLLVWLTGGPGCSGLSGLLFEIGPMKFDVASYDGGVPPLVYHPYSWTKACNIIFLDFPVGTGFSYAGLLPESYSSGDIVTGREMYTFMKKWFIHHPEFISNPFFIGGDSYAGKIVPIISQAVANGNQDGNEPIFNLKGYLIGNGATDVEYDSYGVPQFLHGMGLISDELYESTNKLCGGQYANPGVGCSGVLNSMRQSVLGVNTVQILEPLCFYASPRRPDIFASSRKELIQEHIDQEVLHPKASLLPTECRSSGYILSAVWANIDVVREALGIRKGTTGFWLRCNYGGLHYRSDVTSSIKYHLDLTSRGYRALIYSGDHDMVIPFVGTQAWIRSLNFSIVDDWRSWIVDGQVGGFTRKYANNLTFATIKGGGHTAPEYRPKECLEMIQRWTSDVPL